MKGMCARAERGGSALTRLKPRLCLLRGAGGVVLFHTHPSGDPTPSYEDLQFTRRMVEAAAVVGVKLLDHLVLGATGQWVSLKRQGEC